MTGNHDVITTSSFPVEDLSSKPHRHSFYTCVGVEGIPNTRSEKTKENYVGLDRVNTNHTIYT